MIFMVALENAPVTERRRFNQRTLTDDGREGSAE